MNTTRYVQISVRGRLSSRLASTFEGMTLEQLATGSRLHGTVGDQAELHGLLARIRDLGLELQSITILDAPPGAEPARAGHARRRLIPRRQAARPASEGSARRPGA